MRLRGSESEASACERTAHIIGDELQTVLTLSSKPDEDERKLPAVDGLYDSAMGRFVFEHTRIETFKHQLHEASKFDELVVPLAAELTKSLTLAATYLVAIDVGFVKSLKPSCEAYDWLRSTVFRAVARLEESDCPDVTVIEVEIPGTTKKLHIYRAVGGHVPPNFTISRNRPSAWKDDMLGHMRNRLRDKLPKLQTASNYASSVLIIELTEVALSSWQTVQEAYIVAISECRAAGLCWEPDWVVLVQLDRENYQYAVVVKDPSGHRPQASVRRVELRNTTRDLLGMEVDS